MGKIRLNAGFSFFLSLYQPNNSLENISIFSFSPSSSQYKKSIVMYKKFLRGNPCTPQVTPMNFDFHKERSIQKIKATGVKWLRHLLRTDELHPSEN
jgi:hypothetical protein